MMVFISFVRLVPFVTTAFAEKCIFGYVVKVTPLPNKAAEDKFGLHSTYLDSVVIGN